MVRLYMDIWARPKSARGAPIISGQGIAILGQILDLQISLFLQGGTERGTGGKWTRETREGWPLLIVETEANGDSWRTYERGPFLVL